MKEKLKMLAPFFFIFVAFTFWFSLHFYKVGMDKAKAECGNKNSIRQSNL